MGHIPSLKGLRAIAAIGVVAFHVRLPGVPGGFIGVDIFFVLSGFLITSMLLFEAETTGRIAWRAFLWRRTVRLVPALFLMLTGVILAAPFIFPGFEGLTEVLLTGLYLSNVSQAAWKLPVVTAHSWSLATEMQYYLVWPFVVMALTRVDRRNALLALLAFFALATVWRVVIFWEDGWVRAYYAPGTRLSGLALGSALALVRWRPSPGAAGPIGICALLVLAVFSHRLIFGDEVAASWGGTLVEGASALLILSLTTRCGIVDALLSTPLMAKLGAWSYGIYLWHFPIALVARDHLEPVAAMAVTLGLSVTLAAASFGLVERPLLQKLRRIPPTISLDARPRHPPAT